MTHTVPQSDRTPGTLLSRVRDMSDEAAWEEFVTNYGPLILKWCRQQGLQDSDCADVTQDVLTRLVTAMRTFEYRPGRGRFRGWLKTVTQNAVRDFVAARRRAVRGGGGDEINRLLQACESPDTVAELQRALESQAELEVLREAEARVKLRVSEKNWDAWWLSVREDVKASDVAGRLEIDVADVYVARSRINRMIREQVSRMDALTMESIEPESHGN